MREKRVDARGLACPQPVVLTRDAIRAGRTDRIRVTVDSDVAAQNVRRMGKSQGWGVATEREGDDIHVVLTKGADGIDSELDETKALSSDAGSGAPKVIVFVTSDLLGVGDEELGRILMRAFVKTIKDLEPRPAQLIFANSGVRLTTEGSGLTRDLRGLAESGVEVISCGTCLDYYGLVEKLEVGRASNMFEIASALVGADRVVKL